MFEVLKQLKGLLSSRNLYYLDGILTMLIDRNASPQVYDAFWGRFKKYFPHEGASNEAWAGLRKLHDIVKQQLKTQGGVNDQT